MTQSPLLLLILDGWGVREDTRYNAIAQADTPNWDKLWTSCPHTTINASGEAVGLPEGQMGNSEVGHLNIGAGRVVYQDLTRITRDIRIGAFFENAVLQTAVQKVKAANSTLHIFGLLSPGGIHSHETQLQAMLELAAKAGLTKICLHAFLDGRDTPPKSAMAYIQNFEAKCQSLGVGRIASICGRFYAMDRDNRWDRVERAYRMLTEGHTDFHASSAEIALQQAYDREETDEFVQPTCIHAEGEAPITIDDSDAVVFMNFRTDRAREISRAFTRPDFDSFARQKWPKLSAYVTLTRYAADIPAEVAYPPESLENGLGEYLSKLHIPQFRIAETEKYAHVTFFFNGGVETEYPGETRELIPSPKVSTYDLQPEMSVRTVSEKLVTAIRSGKYPVIICNFANPDMLGHTGVFDAAVKSISALDNCLGDVMAAIDETGGQMIVTADHGNVECMFDDETGQPHTAHTTSPVPVVYYGKHSVTFNTDHDGALADIAPTILRLLQLEQPTEMTGVSLLTVND